MTKRKPRSMAGTARCDECGALAEHERGPDTPLIIRHLETCSERLQLGHEGAQ